MHAKNKRVIAVLPRGKKDFQEHKQRALRLARERLRHFNQWYGYAIGNVSVRNNKTRWGSCSRKGDISFNYQIAHLDPLLADYVIVHELCHIGQFNHSKAFWELVARTIPDHVERRKKLRLVSH
jgi:predicted metal-dependent hydrolase